MFTASFHIQVILSKTQNEAKILTNNLRVKWEFRIRNVMC